MPLTTGYDVNKREITEKVGGGTWFPFDTDADISPIIEDITEALTGEAYVISYTTTNPVTDGSTRAVDIEIDEPDGGLLYEQGNYTSPS